MIRVLVADDEALVRDGLSAIAELEDDIEVVGEAANGKQAVVQNRALRPDVVLMDVRMPDMDGIEATRRILAEPQPPRVIVLTTFDRNEYVYEAMRAGASGFLLKDVRRGQLADAVRAVMRGDTLVAPAITRRLIEEFCRAPGRGTDSPRELSDLTAREVEVLDLVGRGLSNPEIGVRLSVAETTVKTHVARILSKLGVHDRAQAVIVAYETGLVRPGQAGPQGG
ncbi:MAG: response regulator transcription factor [Candidatus Dormibacteria bacterium]